VLRRGRPYASLDLLPVKDCRDGHTLAEMSAINAGIIRKDLARIPESRAALQRFTTRQLVDICIRAGTLFLEGTLPLGDRGHQQSPDDYIRALSATSGLPHTLVRRNMRKLYDALALMPDILNGLTRGIDPDILDAGFGVVAGSRVSFFPVTNCLGLVMPSNSPGVNSLWLPAIPLKMPVILKPGREEPWTPFRLIQALIAAGCPAEAFGFYPTDHEGAGEILRRCGRALIFGDKSTTAQYAHQPGIQIHGPGYSKVLIGEDEIDRWPEHLDVLAASIADNGGRSCVNASAVVVPRHGAAIAEALARRLVALQPRPAEDPQAALSAFANPKMAEYIDATLETDLKTPGATDVSQAVRNTPRKTVLEGGIYLHPTIVRCDSRQHPLVNREFLFPYASVVEVPQAEMLSHIGPSLVVTAITRDAQFTRALLDCPLIERLNLGPKPTSHVSWDQPHEGNLFEFLYRRRAIEKAW
jgi:hypothetical protein